MPITKSTIFSLIIINRVGILPLSVPLSLTILKLSAISIGGMIGLATWLGLPLIHDGYTDK
jgi:hypothetical protein